MAEVNNNGILIRDVETKNIMTKSPLPVGGYSVHPYVGCTHGYKYCYASFMQRFTGHTEPWGTFLDVKHIVSDLEAVANEIILLRKGVVLEMQKPASLLEQLNGQVWLVTVPAADEAALTKQYTCSNVMHTDAKSVIRLLIKSAPRPDAVPAAPNMEDLYLYYFGR